MSKYYQCQKCGKIFPTSYDYCRLVDEYCCCDRCGGHIFEVSTIENNVTQPSHYIGNIETIDFIKDKLTPNQFVGYCIGNCLKYLSRYQKKNGKEDLQKAQVYLNWAIENYCEDKTS